MPNLENPSVTKLKAVVVSCLFKFKKLMLNPKAIGTVITNSIIEYEIDSDQLLKNIFWLLILNLF